MKKSKAEKKVGVEPAIEGGSTVDLPATAADRENPDKLVGKALRELAYNSGLARSVIETMSDEQIRLQLRMVIHRKYELEPA